MVSADDNLFIPVKNKRENAERVEIEEEKKNH
jgi:hypothetical protein